MSMTTYIRNYIDHPGDDSDNIRLSPTLEEITKSIENMLNILDTEF